jgi:hypothetical protein
VEGRRALLVAERGRETYARQSKFVSQRRRFCPGQRHATQAKPQPPLRAAGRARAVGEGPRSVSRSSINAPAAQPHVRWHKAKNHKPGSNGPKD